jgi:NADH-quinone oxidoreductase subunit I
MGLLRYITDIVKGGYTLVQGLAITFRYSFTPPITLQYPDERADLPLRFRGRLALPVDPEKGDNRCTACMLCVKACPNASLQVTKLVDETGKPRPKASAFQYNLGTCMFCNLCVEACTFAALIMSDEYELSTNDRKTLTLDLLGEKYQLKGKKAPWWQGKFKSE